MMDKMSKKVDAKWNLIVCLSQFNTQLVGFNIHWAEMMITENIYIWYQMEEC